MCYATQNRQDAVRAIADACDLLLVIGSSNSSNTARLAEVAARAGCRAELLEDETELDLGWLRDAADGRGDRGRLGPAGPGRAGGRGSGDPRARSRSRSEAVRNEQVNFPLPVEVR